MASPNVEFKCFVGGFGHYTDEKDLERAFSKFGNVIDSKIIRNHVTGISRNFGFITFKDKKSMNDAIEEMNGRKLDGSKADPKDVGFECFVDHLAECTTEKDLERGFSLYGEVIDSEIVYDTETHKSRRFGYVTFRDKESMRNATEDFGGFVDDLYDDRKLDATRIINGHEHESLNLHVKKSQRSDHQVITVKEAWPSKRTKAAEKFRLVQNLLSAMSLKPEVETNGHDE